MAGENTKYMGSYTSDLSPEMKEFYSKDLLEMATANLVHAQFGDKTSIPRNGGKTIEWRMFKNFAKALTPLTEGVTPDPTAAKVVNLSKTLEEFGAYTVVTDILDMTAIDNVIVEITQKHADNMGLTLDTIVRNELAQATNIVYGGDATSIEKITDADKLTPDLIAKAVTVLKKFNAPKIDGSYVAIVHPSVTYDLITNDDWIDVQKYQNASNIFEGEIGKLYGVRFVESTEALIQKNDTTAVYSCFFLGKGAYKVVDVAGAGAEIIVKSAGSSGTADPLNQRSTIGWKIPMYGAKLTIPEYCVNVMVGSSLGATDFTTLGDATTN